MANVFDIFTVTPSSEHEKGTTTSIQAESVKDSVVSCQKRGKRQDITETDSFENKHGGKVPGNDTYEDEQKSIKMDNTPSFVIPKLKRKEEDLLTEITTDSHEFLQEILPSITKSYRCPSSQNRFTFYKAKTVHNTDITQAYLEKRRELKQAGYSDRDVADSYAFLFVESDAEVEQLCKEGIKVGNHPASCLGDPLMGVQLSKHADVLRPTSLTGRFKGQFIMFKVIKGRVKAVFENRNPPYLEPTPNHDCHVSKANPVDINTGTPLQIFESSQLYLYEYGDLTVEDYPRHISPFAVVSFLYKDDMRPPKPLDIPTVSPKLPSPMINISPGGKPLQSPVRERSDEEYTTWTGQLSVKGLFTCRVEMVSTAARIKPVKIGTTLNVTKKCSLPLAQEKYFGQLSSLRKNGEVYWRGNYINVCELRPKADSRSQFQKVMNYLGKNNSMAVLKPDSDTVLLLMPDCSLTYHLGLTKPHQYPIVLHCIFLSKQSCKFKSPRYTINQCRFQSPPPRGSCSNNTCAAQSAMSPPPHYSSPLQININNNQLHPSSPSLFTPPPTIPQVPDPWSSTPSQPGQIPSPHTPSPKFFTPFNLCIPPPPPPPPLPPPPPPPPPPEVSPQSFPGSPVRWTTYASKQMVKSPSQPQLTVDTWVPSPSSPSGGATAVAALSPLSRSIITARGESGTAARLGSISDAKMLYPQHSPLPGQKPFLHRSISSPDMHDPPRPLRVTSLPLGYDEGFVLKVPTHCLLNQGHMQEIFDSQHKSQQEILKSKTRSKRMLSECEQDSTITSTCPEDEANVMSQNTEYGRSEMALEVQRQKSTSLQSHSDVDLSEGEVESIVKNYVPESQAVPRLSRQLEEGRLESDGTIFKSPSKMEFVTSAEDMRTFLENNLKRSTVPNKGEKSTPEKTLSEKTLATAAKVTPKSNKTSEDQTAAVSSTDGTKDVFDPNHLSTADDMKEFLNSTLTKPPKRPSPRKDVKKGMNVKEKLAKLTDERLLRPILQKIKQYKVKSWTKAKKSPSTVITVLPTFIREIDLKHFNKNPKKDSTASSSDRGTSPTAPTSLRHSPSTPSTASTATSAHPNLPTSSSNTTPKNKTIPKSSKDSPVLPSSPGFLALSRRNNDLALQNLSASTLFSPPRHISVVADAIQVKIVNTYERVSPLPKPGCLEAIKYMLHGLSQDVASTSLSESIMVVLHQEEEEEDIRYVKTAESTDRLDTDSSGDESMSDPEDSDTGRQTDSHFPPDTAAGGNKTVVPDKTDFEADHLTRENTASTSDSKSNDPDDTGIQTKHHIIDNTATRINTSSNKPGVSNVLTADVQPIPVVTGTAAVIEPDIVDTGDINTADASDDRDVIRIVATEQENLVSSDAMPVADVHHIPVITGVVADSANTSRESGDFMDIPDDDWIIKDALEESPVKTKMQLQSRSKSRSRSRCRSRSKVRSGNSNDNRTEIKFKKKNKSQSHSRSRSRSRSRSKTCSRNSNDNRTKIKSKKGRNLKSHTRSRSKSQSRSQSKTSKRNTNNRKTEIRSCNRNRSVSHSRSRSRSSSKRRSRSKNRYRNSRDSTTSKSSRKCSNSVISEKDSKDKSRSRENRSRSYRVKDTGKDKVKSDTREHKSEDRKQRDSDSKSGRYSRKEQHNSSKNSSREKEKESSGSKKIGHSKESSSDRKDDKKKESESDIVSNETSRSRHSSKSSVSSRSSSKSTGDKLLDKQLKIVSQIADSLSKQTEDKQRSRHPSKVKDVSGKINHTENKARDKHEQQKSSWTQPEESIKSKVNKQDKISRRLSRISSIADKLSKVETSKKEFSTKFGDGKPKSKARENFEKLHAEKLKNACLPKIPGLYSDELVELSKIQSLRLVSESTSPSFKLLGRNTESEKPPSSAVSNLMNNSDKKTHSPLELLEKSELSEKSGYGAKSRSYERSDNTSRPSSQDKHGSRHLSGEHSQAFSNIPHSVVTVASIEKEQSSENEKAKSSHGDSPHSASDSQETALQGTVSGQPVKNLSSSHISEERHSRQFHPYRNTRKQKPMASFNIGIQDMDVLLADLTASTLKQKRLEESWSFGLYHNFRQQSRFSAYRFIRNPVLPSPEKSRSNDSIEEKTDFTADNIPEFEKRKQQADLLDDFFMGGASQEPEMAATFEIEKASYNPEGDNNALKATDETSKESAMQKPITTTVLESTVSSASGITDQNRQESNKENIVEENLLCMSGFPDRGRPWSTGPSSADESEADSISQLGLICRSNNLKAKENVSQRHDSLSNEGLDTGTDQEDIRIVLSDNADSRPELVTSIDSEPSGSRILSVPSNQLSNTVRQDPRLLRRNLSHPNMTSATKVQTGSDISLSESMQDKSTVSSSFIHAVSTDITQEEETERVTSFTTCDIDGGGEPPCSDDPSSEKVTTCSESHDDLRETPMDLVDGSNTELSPTENHDDLRKAPMDLVDHPNPKFSPTKRMSPLNSPVQFQRPVCARKRSYSCPEQSESQLARNVSLSDSHALCTSPSKSFAVLKDMWSAKTGAELSIPLSAQVHSYGSTSNIGKEENQRPYTCELDPELNSHLSLKSSYSKIPQKLEEMEKRKSEAAEMLEELNSYLDVPKPKPIERTASNNQEIVIDKKLSSFLGRLEPSCLLVSDDSASRQSSESSSQPCSPDFDKQAPFLTTGNDDNLFHKLTTLKRQLSTEELCDTSFDVTRAATDQDPSHRSEEGTVDNTATAEQGSKKAKKRKHSRRLTGPHPDRFNRWDHVVFPFEFDPWRDFKYERNPHLTSYHVLELHDSPSCDPRRNKAILQRRDKELAQQHQRPPPTIIPKPLPRRPDVNPMLERELFAPTLAEQITCAAQARRMQLGLTSSLSTSCRSTEHKQLKLYTQYHSKSSTQKTASVQSVLHLENLSRIQSHEKQSREEKTKLHQKTWPQEKHSSLVERPHTPDSFPAKPLKEKVLKREGPIKPCSQVVGSSRSYTVVQVKDTVSSSIQGTADHIPESDTSSKSLCEPFSDPQDGQNKTPKLLAADVKEAFQCHSGLLKRKHSTSCQESAYKSRKMDEVGNSSSKSIPVAKEHNGNVQENRHSAPIGDEPDRESSLDKNVTVTTAKETLPCEKQKTDILADNPLCSFNQISFHSDKTAQKLSCDHNTGQSKPSDLSAVLATNVQPKKLQSGPCEPTTPLVQSSDISKASETVINLSHNRVGAGLGSTVKSKTFDDSVNSSDLIQPATDKSNKTQNDCYKQDNYVATKMDTQTENTQPTVDKVCKVSACMTKTTEKTVVSIPNDESKDNTVLSDRTDQTYINSDTNQSGNQMILSVGNDTSSVETASSDQQVEEQSDSVNLSLHNFETRILTSSFTPSESAALDKKLKQYCDQVTPLVDNIMSQIIVVEDITDSEQDDNNEMEKIASGEKHVPRQDIETGMAHNTIPEGRNIHVKSQEKQTSSLVLEGQREMYEDHGFSPIHPQTPAVGCHKSTWTQLVRPQVQRYGHGYNIQPQYKQNQSDELHSPSLSVKSSYLGQTAKDHLDKSYTNLGLLGESSYSVLPAQGESDMVHTRSGLWDDSPCSLQPPQDHSSNKPTKPGLLVDSPYLGQPAQKQSKTDDGLSLLNRSPHLKRPTQDQSDKTHSKHRLLGDCPYLGQAVQEQSSSEFHLPSHGNRVYFNPRMMHLWPQFQQSYLQASGHCMPNPHTVISEDRGCNVLPYPVSSLSNSTGLPWNVNASLGVSLSPYQFSAHYPVILKPTARSLTPSPTLMGYTSPPFNMMMPGRTYTPSPITVDQIAMLQQQRVAQMFQERVSQIASYDNTAEGNPFATSVGDIIIPKPTPESSVASQEESLKDDDTKHDKFFADVVKSNMQGVRSGGIDFHAQNVQDISVPESDNHLFNDMEIANDDSLVTSSVEIDVGVPEFRDTLQSHVDSCMQDLHQFSDDIKENKQDIALNLGEDLSSTCFSYCDSVSVPERLQYKLQQGEKAVLNKFALVQRQVYESGGSRGRVTDGGVVNVDDDFFLHGETDHLSDILSNMYNLCRSGRKWQLLIHSSVIVQLAKTRQLEGDLLETETHKKLGMVSAYRKRGIVRLVPTCDCDRYMRSLYSLGICVAKFRQKEFPMLKLSFVLSEKADKKTLVPDGTRQVLYLQPKAFMEQYLLP